MEYPLQFFLYFLYHTISLSVDLLNVSHIGSESETTRGEQTLTLSLGLRLFVIFLGWIDNALAWDIFKYAYIRAVPCGCVRVCVNLRQLQSVTSLTLFIAVFYFHSDKKISTKMFSFFGFLCYLHLHKLCI